MFSGELSWLSRSSCSGSNSEVLADAMASQLIMDGYCESRALNLRSEVEAMISATESLGYV